MHPKPSNNEEREKYNEYMRCYMQKRQITRRLELIAELGGKCLKCGSTNSLEFDHIDSATKRFDIGTYLNRYSMDKLRVELAKCQLLCSECHRLKTMADNGLVPAKNTHGTLSAYRHCGPPKCEACKMAKRMAPSYLKLRSRRQDN